MTVRELRQKYLDFFQSKGHDVAPSGSLIPYDVTGRLDESLLFNGAGMVQFKPYFRGVATPKNKRVTTAQKCLRTGDIDEVGDLSHLTFFEMMGNFSFGDYFKAEAIAYSWEFLTQKQWLGLDPKKLSFTVFEEDDLAYGEWVKHFESVGIDGTKRVFRLGEETNYWPAGAFSSGPPGPCGPNSEMFYWTGVGFPPEGPYGAEDFVRDDKAGLWMEIWNDVFIQYEWQGELKDPSRPDKGYTKTGMPNLPFQSIDTGMGLERTAAVLGGKSSVYDTDAFTAIFAMISELSGRRVSYGSEEKVDVAMRVVADHLRAACFCIADGVLPSNGGRGYVLRRLIRRAVLKGARVLGFEDLFLHLAAQAVIAEFGEHYRELMDQSAVITETLRNEEAQFRRTLEAGESMLAAILEDGKVTGFEAFQLYDTFGFPLEVTQEIAAEAGVEVDVEGFRDAMLEAQERSRAASGMDTVYAGVTVLFQSSDAGATPTETMFYDTDHAEATVTGAMPLPLVDGEDLGGKPQFVVALDRTPFYAESGGQVADTGTIEGDGFRLKVNDVTKQAGVWVHLVESEVLPGMEGYDSLSDEEKAGRLNDVLFGKRVRAEVDASRRRAVTRNHTATHLLHAALRKVLGTHVTQAGSLVAPDHLRFDFTHGQGMTAEQVREVEEIVYDEVLKAQPVTIYPAKTIDEAREMGAMMLFGEKYGEVVRVVQIGGMSESEPSFSRELCGGIHVRNTGEIGLFKILSESSAASGVRRITATTGLGAYGFVSGLEETVSEASAKLKSKPDELVSAIERLQENLREEKKKREKLAQQGAGASAVEEFDLGSVVLKVQRMTDADASDVKLVADRLVDSGANVVALVSNVAEGKVTFACKVGAAALASGAKAGDLVREVAKVTGGGGGGKPEFATAGGRDASKLDEAVARAREVLGG